METAWDKLRYNPVFGPAVPWDFKAYTPQVVVVAVGQNDAHPEDYMKEDYDGARAVEWRARYSAFLRKLRETYPEATIICCTTILGHASSWDRAIEEAVTGLQDEGITKYTFRRNGSGTPGHLRIPEAEEMAGELAAYIRTLRIPGWEEEDL